MIAGDTAGVAGRPSVAIICPGPTLQGGALQRAFEQLGWRAEIFVYGEIGRRQLLSRALGKLSGRYRRAYVALAFNAVLFERLLRRHREARFDLVLIIKGDWAAPFIGPRLAELDAKVVLWTLDSLGRASFQNSLRPYVDQAYYMDGGDALAHAGTWLPLGYDGTLFHPRPSAKDLDVVFVGNCGGAAYESRRHYYRLLLESELPREYRCLHLGAAPSDANGHQRDVGGALPSTGFVSVKEYAAVIARARLAINVHQDDGVRPVNPSFFSIPGCKTCQLVEDRSYLHRWLEPGTHYIPFGKDDFLEQVRTALHAGDVVSQTAERGYLAATAAHTYRARVETMTRALGLGDPAGLSARSSA